MRIEYEGYFISPDKNIPTCCFISTVGKGGKIPDMLTGLFTTPTIAKKEIDRYRTIKDLKNAKTNSESGS
jgi:hypothetical protein